jgi:hypothetical protein
VEQLSFLPCRRGWTGAGEQGWAKILFRNRAA